jgi:hypothetical protein
MLFSTLADRDSVWGDLVVGQRTVGFTLLLTAAVVLVTLAMVLAPSLAGVGARASTTAAQPPSGSSLPLTAIEAAPRAPVSSLSGAPAGAVMTGSYSGDASVFVTFALTNSSQLNELLSALANPQSPQYHQHLTETEFITRFSPAAAPYAEAENYFGSVGGLRVLSYADRIGMQVQGPAASIAAAFGVTLASYTSAGRGTYYAPVGPPTLPAPIASSVVQLEGLSSYLDAQTMLAGAAPLPNLSPNVPMLGGYPTPQNCGTAQCLYGSDLQVAYDEQALLNVTLPTGEQVATILWAGCTILTTGQCPADNLTGGYDPNDVYRYFNDTIPAGQPHSTVIGVPFDGAPSPGVEASYDVSGTVFENTLDVDMVGSLAPGSTIYNVYGLSSLDSETDGAMAYVLNNLPSVQVITNSWGGQDHVDAAWSSYMQEAATRGITVLASSGDAGDSSSSSRWVGTNTEFPSSVGFDDYGVTGVGGTTLTVRADPFPTGEYLHIASQIVWYDPVFGMHGSAQGWDQIGSSGGVSSYYKEPSWQVSSEANGVILSAGEGSQRGVPDVAAIANNTFIYLSVNGSSPQAYWAWGTSVASPVTAGLFAEIDAVLAHYSMPSLGFVDPTIYTWGDAMVKPFENTSSINFIRTGVWNTTLPSPPFSDVTVGMNLAYDALPGYDLVTGWGSLDAYNFTTYVLNYNYSGQSFSLNGVESVLSLTGLNVTSAGVPYNASVQQNFFLANSLGAPLYWIQNVIYIAWSPSGWAVNYTGWVVFPFWGLFESQSVYEYNFPVNGSTITTPITWTIRSWLTDNGPDPMMNFQVNSNVLQLPVPGAAFIIGGYNYQYYWQGSEYSNGPRPNNPSSGGLAPQLGLVGGPTLGLGDFQDPTAGSLTSEVQMSGQSQFIPTPFAAPFGGSVDQTGEVAENLAWTETGSTWNVSVKMGSFDQGVVSFTVANAGNPANQSATDYDVSFTETGLTTATHWSVTFNGGTETCAVGAASAHCASDTIVFSAPNGEYTFAINATGYSASPQSGSILVSGGPATEPIVFTQVVTYAVTFTETGLVGSFGWTVTLDGVPQTSGQSSIEFLEPNGQHSFVVTSSGYSADPAAGTITVSGGPAGQDVTFTKVATFTLMFIEGGLPGNTGWSVTVRNVGSNSSSGSNVSFRGLTNGDYSFQIGPPSGYTATPSSGSVTINGANYSESISFSSGGGGGNSTVPPFSLFGLSGNTLIIALSVIVVACVAVAAVAAIRARRAPAAGQEPPGASAPPPAPYGGPPPPTWGPGPPGPGMPPPPGPPPGPGAASAPAGSTPVRSCPRCGSPAALTSHFCPNCGGPLG